jgi:hypothetical protein
MATLGGSTILGWGDRCGTLEPGKEADMVLVDSQSLKRPYLASEQNPIDALVYRGRSSDVDTVMVAGEILYQQKKHRRLNPQAILKQLRESIKPAASDSRDNLDTELLPYVLRYYEAWDTDSLTPHHIVNSR